MHVRLHWSGTAGVVLSVLSELNNSPLAVFTVDKCCFDIHTHAGMDLPIRALVPSSLFRN